MIVGLDLSLTATGICDICGPRVYTSKRRGMERLCDVVDNVVFDIADDELVLIEGYAMGTGRQAGTYAIGELGGVVRFALWQREIAYVDVPPAVLKKFATGKGNANKDAMILAAAKHGYDGPADNNAIDAWWLRQLGLYHLEGHTTPRIPCALGRTAYRDDIVANIEWPNA